MDVHTGGRQARLEDRLKQITRQARVFANHNSVARLRKHFARRPAKFQNELGRHRAFADACSYTVGAEVFTPFFVLHCHKLSAFTL